VKFVLERVHFMPKELKPGVLYVSEEFGIAAHLCACGCGAKIRTPLGPTDWSVEETDSGPSLSPSIGNWQERCQSHYWIDGGEVRWAPKWTAGQIAAGRRREEEHSQAYYEELYGKSSGSVRRFFRWLKHLWKSKSNPR
jgi:hypothetical protein